METIPLNLRRTPICCVGLVSSILPILSLSVENQRVNGSNCNPGISQIELCELLKAYCGYFLEYVRMLLMLWYDLLLTSVLRVICFGRRGLVGSHHEI